MGCCIKGEIEMNDSFECEPKHDFALAASAKGALESVCSGKVLDSLSRYYSQEFVDHVNDMKFTMTLWTFVTYRSS